MLMVNDFFSIRRYNVASKPIYRKKILHVKILPEKAQTSKMMTNVEKK